MNPYDPPSEMDSKFVGHPIGAFRCSIPFVILSEIAIVLPIHAGMMFLDSKVNGATITYFGLKVLFGIDAILVSISGAFLVAYYKIYFYSDRIVGRSFRGKFHDLAWNDVERIRPIGFLGVKYIRVYSRRNTKVMWIPLFLKDLDQFVVLVCQYADPSNPLIQYFKNNGMVADERRQSKGS